MDIFREESRNAFLRLDPKQKPQQTLNNKKTTTNVESELVPEEERRRIWLERHSKSDKQQFNGVKNTIEVRPITNSILYDAGKFFI